MSAVSQLREVMATLNELVKDYDSDAISITSTVEEDDDPHYTTTGIIAERDHPEKPYLISWEGYPLDQCTWEPPWNIDETDLIPRWEQIKQELGSIAFQRENKKNTEAYEAALERAQVIRHRKHAKRERKRRRLQQQNRTVVPDDDSSDEASPLSARTRDSLFIEDQTTAPPNSSVIKHSHTQQTSVARRLPLEQSSSEGESDPYEENSVRAKSAQRKDRNGATKGTSAGPVLAKKQLQAIKPAKTSNGCAAGKRPGHEASTQIQNATSAASIVSKTAIRSSTAPISMRAIRTAPQKKTSHAIGFVDQAREKQKREWPTDQQYGKVAHRWRAEKRSRNEAAPDFDALTFVNGPPTTLPQAAVSISKHDNPYGRREAGHSRAQEDDHEGLRRVLAEDSAPLASWEINKVPLTCFHWASSTCPRSAQECRFLHRRHDPEGRQYATGSYDGYVPPKYFKPPITCAYCYRGRNCTKTAEDCSYAHEDTGWAELNGVRVEIASLPPESLTTIAPRGPSLRVPPKLQNPPITCEFWLRDPHGCIRSEEVCHYAHWNTGWVHSESNGKGQAVRIDPDQRPRGGLPKFANPPVTCPFWLRSEEGCARADDECKYAHHNTGWAPPGFGHAPAEPINPREMQRSHSRRSTAGSSTLHSNNTPQLHKGITCSSWLRDPQGCPRTEGACGYAHRNTGWATPNGRPSAAPVALDPNQIPRSYRDHMGARLAPKYKTPPITCPNWLRSENGCVKSGEECRFAHRNTGWLPQQGGNNSPNVEISRAEQPRYKGHDTEATFDQTAPKNSTPPITCYFWLKGTKGCTKTTAECRYAHWNTGWTVRLGVSHNPEPEQIDSRSLPRFPQHDAMDMHIAEGNGSESNAQLPSNPAEDCHITATVKMQAFEPQHVQSPLELQDGSEMVTTTVLTVSQLKDKIEKFWNLNIIDMFNSGSPGDNDMLERQAMLLYDPKEHLEELELITRWLLMYDVKVANLWYDGAWSQFREDVAKHKSGVIIVHPEFEHYVDLPGFGDLLKHRVRVWSVGLQPPAWFVEGVGQSPPDMQHDRVGLFPHGGFIYITDDVFEQKPQLALSIIKLFFAKIEQLRTLNGPDSPWLEVDDACVIWRLCVRPELMEYLYLKCKDNSTELAAGNPDFLSRADLYQLLTSTNYIEQDHPAEVLSAVQDKYPILSERREIAEQHPLNYFNRLKNDQEDANTYMIGYYAAMQSADMRRSYRQFYVVHTEPKATCAQQWKSSIHNIFDIITPEQCNEELSKPSKESLFDFLDWAMEPKTEQNTTELEKGDSNYLPMDVSSRMEIHEAGHTAY